MRKEELEARLLEIDARPAEKPSAEDLKAIEAAAAEDTVSLKEFKEDLEKYSGRIMLRIPRSLHKQLKNSAEAEGVSLNTYMLYKLAT